MLINDSIYQFQRDEINYFLCDKRRNNPEKI